MFTGVGRRIEHCRGCAAAGFGAIQHQAEMRWLDMLSTQFQTVQRRALLADAITVKTILDALGQFLGHLLMHGNSSLRVGRDGFSLELPA
jgi:hypothetical protein